VFNPNIMGGCGFSATGKTGLGATRTIGAKKKEGGCKEAGKAGNTERQPVPDGAPIVVPGAELASFQRLPT